MCILCVIQKWSRRAATMLPWLVIPLIGLWALSQLLPPAFRFEITSPRLACVFVLLVTLFWYEILMPQLSLWRVRRNVRLRETKRLEAIEIQKLRKTATRRCRNCLTPYKDQNPGGGRFMCAYCGHNSKRPVLDLLVPPGVGVLNPGIIKDLAGKSGKVWSENSLMCSQDWFENGNWVGGSFPAKSAYWKRSGGAFFGGDDHCLAEQSYFGVFTFACKLMTSFFLSIRWLLKNIFRISLSRDDDSSDADNKGSLAKRGANGAELHETRSDKARRKAEEKRQARLEKELLEEEERKQREEVTRLVEERRRLKDEKMEAENRGRGSVPVTEKVRKKEVEHKRNERKKDKDKGSSKSNADVEELEKKTGEESDRKQDFDKKTDYSKKESVNGSKIVASNNYTKVYAGSRYLDRMKGSFLSSSKAFGGGSFFGKAGITPATSKENRSTGSVEQGRSSPNKKELHQQPESTGGKVNTDAEVKHAGGPVSVDPQQTATPKKTWQQLFTGSSALPPSSYSNVISRPNHKYQSEVQSPRLSSQSSSTQTFDNPINFGLPSPFTRSNYSEGSTISSLNFPSLNESMLPRLGESPHESPILEEPEFFEDPCYVPDPVFLLGPVSESLDSFQLDLGLDKPRSLIREVNKPSPIESPLSRLKMADDKLNGSKFSSHPNVVSRDMHSLPFDDAKSSTEAGTWHMWNSSPLVQDGLGLVNGTASWLLPQEKSRSNMNEFLQPPTYKNTGSLFTKEEEQGYTSTNSAQQVFLRSCQTGGGMYPPLGNAIDHDPWRERPFYPPISGNEHRFPFNPQEEATKKEMLFGSPRKFANNQPLFEPPPANNSSKKENDSVNGEEGVRNSTFVKPHIVGGLYCNPDVQSLWSFD